jgi:hypothetical protein
MGQRRREVARGGQREEARGGQRGQRTAEWKRIKGEDGRGGERRPEEP